MNAILETPKLLYLNDLRARDPLLTGGKASALATLVAEGQPVPEGFVLTPAAFQSSGALRAEMKDLIASALHELGTVAVRSSGIAEDLEGASFAGQYETVLDVNGIDAVLAAIDTCVKSAQAPRVLQYRTERGIESAPMAVLIQKLVRAAAAGVAFTAHPVTGERGVVCISAVRGVGESLVAGVASAEEWEVRDAALRTRGVEPVLTAKEAEAVALLATKIEGEAPVDVEWAITREGGGAHVQILQRRPMTALPEPVRWDVEHPGGYIRNFRLGEWIGAPVTPLFESWMLTDIEERVHNAFEDLFGLSAPRPLHVVVNGWYFYGGMNYDLGPAALFKSLPRVIAGCLGPRRAQVFAATPPLAHLGFDKEVLRWRSELLPAFVATVEKESARVKTASPRELVETVEAIVAATAVQVTSIVGVAGYAAKAEGKLLEFWRKHLPAFDGSVIELVSGAPTAPAGHDVEGLDPIFPTLGERGALPAGPNEAMKQRVLAARDAATARARAALPEKQRATFDKLVNEARRAHVVRMEQTALFTLGWPTLREATLSLARSLRSAGFLEEEEDVFFLTKQELLDAIGGGKIRADVKARRAVWERQRRLAPPLIIGTPKGLLKEINTMLTTVLHHEEHDAPDALVGMPGSAGRVTGAARVVRSVDELSRLKDGEILVCPVTTPAWTLAFSRAKAIVTDTGSIASHASIVAREHGIPAVVATGNGTTRIVDGQLITVDGGRGVVRLQPGPNERLNATEARQS